MWWIINTLMDYAAPVFLVVSPLTSYSDQIYSIHRTKTSAGFSLDIPLIMLVASILKVFYWFGEHYATSLFAQAVIMIGVQLVLLKVSLDNRPPVGIKNGIEHTPFAGADSSAGFQRPYNFWRWTPQRPFWNFLLYLTCGLLAIQILLPPISQSESYIAMLGYVGLGIESFLPVPQILANQKAQSCKGFRLSVLANWLAGDSMKMFYFFCGGDSIPLAFRLSGILQCSCDCYLGVQYWMYGDGENRGARVGTHANGEAWNLEEKSGMRQA